MSMSTPRGQPQPTTVFRDLPGSPSAYITPEPWVPTSPPRLGPLSPFSLGLSPCLPRGAVARRPNKTRAGRHSSQYSTDVSPYSPSGPNARRLRANALGSAAHERLQASLAGPRPFVDVNASGTHFAPFRGPDEVEHGMKTAASTYQYQHQYQHYNSYPPPTLPSQQLVLCGSPLGSPYSSQEENFNFTLRDRVKGPSARSRSPTRRRCVE